MQQASSNNQQTRSKDANDAASLPERVVLCPKSMQCDISDYKKKVKWISILN